MVCGMSMDIVLFLCFTTGLAMILEANGHEILVGLLHY
jgi:hypothetical protein